MTERDPRPEWLRRLRPEGDRIYLSPPVLGPDDEDRVSRALRSGWVAPLGPEVEAFESEMAARIGAPYAVATSTGTAALHLVLRALGVGADDDVVVQDLTFVASAAPVVHLGAAPIFVDSERESWNMDPALLAEELERRARAGRLPKAVVVVHLYGLPADLDPIHEACRAHGVPLVEDAAEALGSSYRDRPAGSIGVAGIFSFNGNKILTTSQGGMIVTADRELAHRVRHLATQAREPEPHYEHREAGHNFRMSNVLAALGRGQLSTLDDRVEARRWIFDRYRGRLGDLPGVTFAPEPEWGRGNRWLTCLLIDPASAGTDRERIRLALEEEDIEARPLWKPMHLQPLFRDAEVVGGEVSEDLFDRGLCLPSGSDLTVAEHDRIVEVVRGCFS